MPSFGNPRLKPPIHHHPISTHGAGDSPSVNPDGHHRKYSSVDDLRSSSSVSGISNGVSGIQGVLLSSKYLKVAQQFLDEVVNLGKGIKSETSKKSTNGQFKAVGESSAMATGDGSVGGETSGKRGAELSTAERQENSNEEG